MEKRECTTQQPSACPVNPVESSVPSSWSGTQKECNSQTNEQPDATKSMYCKDLVFRGDTEFSFEELRAELYIKKLNEKVSHIGKVKEELIRQIEQKQKLIQERSGSIQYQQLDVPQSSLQTAAVSSAPVVPCEMAPVYSEADISKNSAMRSSINHEDMGQGVIGVSQGSSLASFSIFDENLMPEKPTTRSSSRGLKSLKLPTSILKSRQPPSVPLCDKDASLSRSEEAIINAHRNKTLCRSPDNTCDFVCAAQLASTPFGGPARQNPSDRKMEENKNGSVFFNEPNSKPRAEANKLSPIQELSHVGGYTSLASAYLLESESLERPTTHSEITEVVQHTSGKAASAPALVAETMNPCSLDVRKALLDDMDLSSVANFSRKVGPLPDSDDLQFDGDSLFFLRKMGEQGMCLYYSKGGNVLVKVDKSTVPWDFYINTQLRARLPADLQHSHAQSTCYLYENGSLTLWQVPQGQTIQELIEDHVDRRDVPLLTIRLLEMVKWMHSCRLVHGALQPETLMVCHSCEDRVICMDFSNSLDLELQTDVKTVQCLPSAQGYIKQGLLLPSASPYQVDLCGIAEIVHMLLFGKTMKIIKYASYWSLAEECGPLDWQSTLDSSNQLGSLWQNFFHNLLNPEENSTELILSNLINSIKNARYEALECQFSL